MKTFSSKILLLTILFLSSPILVFAYDGVLTTHEPEHFKIQQKNQLRQQVDQYVQQVLINATIKTFADVINRMTKQANIGLMPDFGYLAAQQGALQCFKQESTLETIRDVYEQAVDLSMEQIEGGVHQAQVQKQVFDFAERELGELRENYVFRQIVEKVIEGALRQQQQMMMQQVMAQRMQAVTQQQQNTQKAIENQYKQSLNSVLVR